MSGGICPTIRWHCPLFYILNWSLIRPRASGAGSRGGEGATPARKDLYSREYNKTPTTTSFSRYTTTLKKPDGSISEIIFLSARNNSFACERNGAGLSFPARMTNIFRYQPSGEQNQVVYNKSRGRNMKGKLKYARKGSEKVCKRSSP